MESEVNDLDTGFTSNLKATQPSALVCHENVDLVGLLHGLDLHLTWPHHSPPTFPHAVDFLRSPNPGRKSPSRTLDMCNTPSSIYCLWLCVCDITHHLSSCWPLPITRTLDMCNMPSSTYCLWLWVCDIPLHLSSCWPLPITTVCCHALTAHVWFPSKSNHQMPLEGPNLCKDIS